MCEILYNSDGVVHIAAEDYDYDENQDEDEEIFKEGLAASMPGTNDAPAFNFEMENIYTQKKMRKMVTTFRKSSVKNEVLQKFVILENNKKLSLLLDRKTR